MSDCPPNILLIREARNVPEYSSLPGVLSPGRNRFGALVRKAGTGLELDRERCRTLMGALLDSPGDRSKTPRSA